MSKSQSQPQSQSSAQNRFSEVSRDTAEQQRRIQSRTDRKEGAEVTGPQSQPKDSEKPEAPRTRDRDYPVPPFPQQHQPKPGAEIQLDPAPMYDAPDYKGSGKLEGRTALITGGDSGIGRAVAVLFAREGADIAIVYLEEHEDAEETKAAVEAEGRRCLTIAGDVKHAEFCKEAVAKTLKEFGALHILVNNAAFQQHTQSVLELSEEQFDQTLRTNLYGYFHMAKAAAEHLPPTGAIINTGSVTGLDGSKELLDYSMTKGGIHAFTRSLAGSLLPRGIRVNCVAPGPVWTPLNPADRAAEQVAKFGAQTKMKRPAQPEEIAPAYVFLAAPCCSSYITGEILPIIGGY
jgi:NAD(P)-dependent dehydrogenase (short-subunit alcohol dehydrogenase family)